MLNICEFLLSTLNLHGNEVTDHNIKSQVVSMMVFGENVFLGLSGRKAKLKARMSEVGQSRYK